MPYVPKFKPDQLRAVLAKMEEYPPEKVQQDYLLGKITLNDKLYTLRTYGDAQRELNVMGEQAVKAEKEKGIAAAGGGAKGEAVYWWETMASQYKGAWDAATREKDPSKSEAVFKAMMGSFELLRGLDVPGDIVERKLLEKFPDSPGYARAANWAVWGFVNFYGISAVLKPIFAAAGAGMNVAKAVPGAIKAEWQFLKDPVKYVTAQAMALDTAKAATATAQKAAASAAIAGEAATSAQAFKTAIPATGNKAIESIAAAETPQQLEALTTKELIKFYETRSREMVRSQSAGYAGVSHETTKQAAAKSTISFEDILARGPDKAASATEIEAIKQVHDEVLKGFNASVKEAAEHLDEIRAGGRRDLLQSYKSHLAAAEVTNPAFLSARGQGGRLTEYMKTMQDTVSESKVFDATTRALASEKYLDGSDEAIAQAIQRMANLTNKNRAKLVEETTKHSGEPGLIRTFYKSLIFSRPGSHVANIVGNENNAVLYGLNKTAASVMPASDVSVKEAASYWGGLWDSRTKFFDLWREASEKGATRLEKAGIEGTGQGWLTKHGPLNWLGFEDEFMQGHIGHGLAKSEAAKQALSAWDNLAQKTSINKTKFIGDFIDRSMADPETYQSLIKATEKDAEYIVLHSPMSRAGEYAASAIRNSKLDYLMPVVKFPVASMKMTRDWTPGLQSLSGEYLAALAEGGAKADLMRARTTISWMAASQVMEASKAGLIDGGGPENTLANAIWRAAGHQPYTINGYSYKWIAGVGDWIGIMADTAQASNEMDIKNLGDMFSAAVFVGGRALESNYWLRIIQGLSGAVDDAKRAADFNDYVGAATKIAGQPVKTFVQLGPWGRTYAEMRNPEAPDLKFYNNISGELEDLKQWTFASTPWGKDSRPRLNFSGNKVIIPPAIGHDWVVEKLGAPDWVGRAIGLFTPPMRDYSGSVKDDPVAEILNRRGLVVGDNWKFYGSGADPESLLPMTGGPPRVSLSGDQAYNWKFLSLNDAREYGTNRNWRDAMKAWDEDPRTNTKDRNEQQAEVKRMYAGFRRNGLDMLRKLDPDIISKEKQRDEIEALQRNRPAPPADPSQMEEPQQSVEQPAEYRLNFTQEAAPGTQTP